MALGWYLEKNSMKYFILFFLFLLAACHRKTPVAAQQIITQGDTVYVHFILKHADGKKFDESDHSRHQYRHQEIYPLRVVAGRGDVIKGFDEALLSGLTVGDTLTVSVPPAKAFGEKGVPEFILSNETVSLYIQVVQINKCNACRHF